MKVKVPEFADSSVQAVIISFFVEKGSIVKKGEDLLEIETDKALMKIDSPVAGTVTAVYKKEREFVAQGDELLEIKE